MKNKRITRAVSVVMLLALLVSMLPVIGIAGRASAETNAASSTGPPTELEANPEPKSTSRTFSDVKEGKWYYNGVVWAYAEGITAGTTATTFSPHKELAFSDLSLFLYRFAYSPKPHYQHSSLGAYEGSWYYTSLSWCCDFSIIRIEDVTGGNNPNRQISRNEFVNILYRYANNYEKRSVSVSKNYLADYDDVPQNESDRKAWNWAIDRGIIVGTGPRLLSPDINLDRAQFVVMLYRYKEYCVGKQAAAWLRSETVLGYRIRGWLRRYLECAELAYGVPWQDHAYQIGSDGIPTLIDCSGILEWAFCYSGLMYVPDLESIDLWNSAYFDVVASKPNSKTGYRFINDLITTGSLNVGDMIFCGNSSNHYCRHMMMYLGRKGGSIIVLHSTGGVSASGETGFKIEAIPNVEGSWYLLGIYGVKRFNP